ncbi:MAG: LA_2272 family surface repeat-containing protein [Brevinematia bacterium]
MSKRLCFLLIISYLLLITGFSFSEETNYVKIAVLDITSRTKIEGMDKEFLTERLQIELSKYQQLKIVERLQLKKIIEEQKLQLSGIAEKDAKKIGGLSGAQKIVTGSLTEVDGTYFLIVKVIDTTTAELDFIDQVSGEDASELSEKIASISSQIAKTLLKYYTTVEKPQIKKKEPEKSEVIEEQRVEKQEETTEEKKPSSKRWWFPLGIIFTTPIQLPSPDFTVYGVAYSLIYGRFDGVYGIYLGFIIKNQKMYGLQTGFIEFTQELYGFQAGFMNFSSQKTVGAQIGFLNFSYEITGLQIGFLNKAYRLRGVQIGFLNIISTGGFSPFMFGINMSF